MNPSAKCACVRCDTHLEFPVEMAGQTIDCPNCTQPTELSLPPAELEPVSELSAPELLALFRGSRPRTPVSFFYRIGLVIVALMMLLMPLIYLSLIGLAGWGVFLWATKGTVLLSSTGGGRVFLLKIALYIAPLFAGVILVFFMVKP